MTTNEAPAAGAKDEKNVRQLNWMDDDYGMEVTEGIKFDPEVEYKLELTAIKREAGEKDGKPWERIVLEFAEETTGVTIRQTHFLQPKISKNKDDPKKTNSLIRLANALGHKVEIGDKNFHPKQFLKIGMKITAHIVDQVRRDGTKTGFNEIDVASIKPAGKNAQRQIATNAEDVTKWNKDISDGKYATPEKFVQNLASTGRMAEIGPFMDACKVGVIKFVQ